jgi:hypothetical protein
MEENSFANPAPVQTNSPAPRKHLSLFKKIFYIIFATVCLFGIIRVALQYIYPSAQTTNSNINISQNNVDWKIFTNKKYNFSLKYPQSLKPSETAYSAVFTQEQDQNSSPSYPLLYISVIPDGFAKNKEIYNFMAGEIINKFYSLKDGQELQTETGPDAQYWTFKKLSSLPVAGAVGIIIQNNNVYQGEGLINKRILVKKPGLTYIIGSYYKSQQELDIFHNFFLSFKFLP